MRWTMPATRAPLHSQRASRVIAALTVIATTFAMHAMVRRASRQLKMPRPDAYDQPAQRLVQPDEIPAEAANVSNLAVSTSVRRGDVDAVLVNVQSDVQSARFLHGPSPRKFATT